MVDPNTRLGRLRDARRVFDGVPWPNTFSYNALLSAYARLGSPDDACALFEAIPSPTSAPTTRSLQRSCGRGTAGTHYCSSDMYAKCEQPEEARKVFKAMPERNIVTWNSLITCYEQNGPLGEALVLFVEMMDAGFVPDEVILASVMSACASLAADNVSWNAMIVGYAQNGRAKDALQH
jgi:pentatricopeptide repeat protein